MSEEGVTSEAGPVALSEGAIGPFGPRDVTAARAAETLGFDKRALNGWCSKGHAGDVCPSYLTLKGRQRIRLVNLDEVRDWRRRVGLQEDRNALFNAAAPAAAAAMTAQPEAPQSDQVELPSDIDSQMSLAANLLRQLRAQLIRLSAQDPEKLSAGAVQQASTAAKQVGQELRLLVEAINKRDAAGENVVTRKRALEFGSSLVEVFVGGLARLGADVPAAVRVMLETPGADRVVTIHSPDGFDRIIANACDSSAAQVRRLVADELERVAGELELRHREVAA